MNCWWITQVNTSRSDSRYMPKVVTYMCKSVKCSDQMQLGERRVWSDGRCHFSTRMDSCLAVRFES